MAQRNKVVIFDFDGTIADSAPIIRAIYTEMAKKNNWKPMTDEDYALLRKGSLRDAKRWSGIRFWQFPLLIHSAKKLMQVEAVRVKLFPGVVELIHELSDQGIEVYILSRNLSGTITHVLQRYKLDKKVQILDRRKRSLGSKTAAIQRLIRRKNYARKDVWMIGDEVRDIQAAKRTRINSVAVGWGLQDESILKIKRPSYAVKTVKELRKILLSKD